MTSFAAVLDDLDTAGVALRRAWPRAADHLLLDLDDPAAGRPTAGQWFADPDRAHRVAEATAGAEARHRVVLQPGGADRRLPELRALVAGTNARLVAHRPERRAVVALNGGTRYAKLVPSRKLAALRHGVRRAERLPIRTPRLVGADTDATVATATLPGTPLPELLRGPRAGEALTAVGAAVARLHAAEPPAGAGVHGPADEVAVTRTWERWASTYGLLGSEEGVVDDPPAPPAVLRLIHRDLHDGQFVLAADVDGRFTDTGVGLLDFDLAAAGDPALDLANLVEHLLLRGRQGVLDRPEDAVAALLSGYRPAADVRQRMVGYGALTARRLTALYAFRTANLVT